MICVFDANHPMVGVCWTTAIDQWGMRTPSVPYLTPEPPHGQLKTGGGRF